MLLNCTFVPFNLNMLASFLNFLVFRNLPLVNYRATVMFTKLSVFLSFQPVTPKLKIKENVAPSPKVVSPKIKKGSFIGNDITPDKLEEKPIMNETQKTVTFKEDVLEAILPAGIEIQDNSQKASSHKDSFDMKINKTPDENAVVKESYVDDLADDSGNNYEVC